MRAKEKDGADEPRHDPAPERDDVKVAGNRCPYCHEDVPRETADVCRDCLARHHPACWAEAPRCGTCGCAEVLRAVSRFQADKRPQLESAKSGDLSEGSRLRVEAWSTLVVGSLLCGAFVVQYVRSGTSGSLLAAGLIFLVTVAPGAWMLWKLRQLQQD